MSDPVTTNGADATANPVVSAPGKTVTLTDATYESVVIQSELPVVVDFWAQYCQPCKPLCRLEMLAEEFAGRLVIAKLTRTIPGSETRHSRGIPHLLVYHKGEIIKRHVGSAPRSTFRALFESTLVDIGAESAPFTPEETAELEAAMAAAEAVKNEQGNAASAAYQAHIKDAMAEFEAVRNEFLGRMVSRLDGDKAALATRGAAGDFDEAVYMLFVELRGQMDQPEFADLNARQEAAMELANSPENEVHKQTFARLDQLDAEYDVTVEAARQKIIDARKAGASK
jgi:thioredoxin 1